MFPKMIYRDGKTLNDSRVVNDQAELEAASADGYLPLDMGAFMAAKGAAAAQEKPAAEAPKGKAKK